MNHEGFDSIGSKRSVGDHTVGVHQDTMMVRGIIEKVDIHNNLAVVAIQGGDISQNISDFTAINISKGKFQVIPTADTKGVGSGYTRFIVKIPDNSGLLKAGSSSGVMPLVHCMVAFSKGTFKPSIVSFETVIDGPAGTDTVIIQDNSDPKNPGIRIAAGGDETRMAVDNGPPGYRFSPWAQNPSGSHVTTASGMSLIKLNKAINKGPKAVQEALKTTTPAGHATIVDDTGQGHHMVFGDVSTTMTKSRAGGMMGSNLPESMSLKNPLINLTDGLGLGQQTQPVPTSLDPNPVWQIPAPLVALASAELDLWQADRGGFVALPEMFEGFTQATGTQSSRLSGFLSASAKDHSNNGLNYMVSAAMSAACTSLGTVLISGGSTLAEPSPAVLTSGTYAPTGSAETFRAGLQGNANAWAALVAALRLSILHSGQATQLISAIKFAPLLAYAPPTAAQALTMAVPNMFGFPTSAVGNNGLKGGVGSYIRSDIRTAYPTVTLSTSPASGDQLTYGDLMSINMSEIKASSTAWTGTYTPAVGVTQPDIFVPNVIAFKQVTAPTGLVFQDRIYFTAGGYQVPYDGTSYTSATVPGWVCGFYAAQVRTLLQEIFMITQQYLDDVGTAGIGSGIDTLEPLATKTLVTDYGDSYNISAKAWTTSFIGYLMVRLFNGSAGRTAAQGFLASNPDDLEALTESTFDDIMNVSRPQFSDSLSKVWWDTTLDRMITVSNVLSQSRNLLKTV